MGRLIIPTPPPWTTPRADRIDRADAPAPADRFQAIFDLVQQACADYHAAASLDALTDDAEAGERMARAVADATQAIIDLDATPDTPDGLPF